ncbi:MAG: lipoyl(octanoyl) transferase [Deltaproteobacteria bacterium]|nr:lipoyl(octanoyl) transferase [Deltaproteobacteria bacterium]
MPTSQPVEVIRLSPWNETPYNTALAVQRELAEAGRTGWLLFCCPPTITLGKRAPATDVLLSREELERREIRVLEVDRGGQATYHGPGQVVGFPFGKLEDFIGDPRGVRAFVVRLKRVLALFIARELWAAGDRERRVDAARAEDAAGLWFDDGRKVVALGLGFGRAGIRHGFSLNLQPLEREFAAINPCGEKGALPGSVWRKAHDEAAFEGAVSRLIDILKAEHR